MQPAVTMWPEQGSVAPSLTFVKIELEHLEVVAVMTKGGTSWYVVQVHGFCQRAMDRKESLDVPKYYDPRQLHAHCGGRRALIRSLYWRSRTWNSKMHIQCHFAPDHTERRISSKTPGYMKIRR